MDQSEYFKVLPPKDYSGRPRKQTRIIGQIPALGKIDMEDGIDAGRMDIIDKTTIDSMEGGRNSKDELLLFAQRGIEEGGFVFGVKGSEKVGTEEIGELQGWICFYQDEIDRLQRARQKNIHIPTNSRCPVIEVSYAKYPKALEKQMQSGLRQALVKLAGMNAVLDTVDEVQSIEPNLVITAYVTDKSTPETDAAAAMLKSAGFEEKGLIEYTSGAEILDRIYVLNWNKLDGILKRDALRETGKSILPQK